MAYAGQVNIGRRGSNVSGRTAVAKPAGRSTAFDYLGHFRNPANLRAGHNEVPGTRGFGERFRPKAARQLLRSDVNRTPGSLASQVAAARPVIAARQAARAAGLAGSERRAAVAAARLSPESRLSERAARGSRQGQRRLTRIAKRTGGAVVAPYSGRVY